VPRALGDMEHHRSTSISLIRKLIREIGRSSVRALSVARPQDVDLYKLLTTRVLQLSYSFQSLKVWSHHKSTSCLLIRKLISKQSRGSEMLKSVDLALLSLYVAYK